MPRIEHFSNIVFPIDWYELVTCIIGQDFLTSTNEAMGPPISSLAVKELTICVISHLAFSFRSKDPPSISEFLSNTLLMVSKIEYVFRPGLVI